MAGGAFGEQEWRQYPPEAQRALDREWSKGPSGRGICIIRSGGMHFEVIMIVPVPSSCPPAPPPLFAIGQPGGRALHSARDRRRLGWPVPPCDQIQHPANPWHYDT